LLPGRTSSALISNFVERESINNNKKDKAFLIIEIRIAIQGAPSIASMYKCVAYYVDSSQTDLFSSPWSPSPIGLCCF
jgi:hypothetical protein